MNHLICTFYNIHLFHTAFQSTPHHMYKCQELCSSLHFDRDWCSWLQLGREIWLYTNRPRLKKITTLIWTAQDTTTSQLTIALRYTLTLYHTFCLVLYIQSTDWSLTTALQTLLVLACIKYNYKLFHTPQSNASLLCQFKANHAATITANSFKHDCTIALRHIPTPLSISQ